MTLALIYGAELSIKRVRPLIWFLVFCCRSLFTLSAWPALLGDKFAMLQTSSADKVAMLFFNVCETFVRMPYSSKETLTQLRYSDTWAKLNALGQQLAY